MPDTASELFDELVDKSWGESGIPAINVAVKGYPDALKALEELGHGPKDYCQVAACPGCVALADARERLLEAQNERP